MALKRRGLPQTGENGRSKSHNSSSNRQKTHGKGSHENGRSQNNEENGNSKQGIPYLVLMVALACTCGYLHRNHIAHLFESDRHFSHLSTLERELAFRTEMGLYYSYYKTIIEAPTLYDGLHSVMYDNITEYPQVINVLKRFNLYPEVILGIGFRGFETVANFFNIQTKLCWKVNRGENLSPVWSCEGLGEPSYFYIESVFLLNGIMMMLFFLFGTYLSGSILGGAVTVMCFFYNHGECTRVQWTPPLRESFAYPFLVMQMFIITKVLRAPYPSYKDSVLIAAITVCFMLPWQFAQFALLTQTIAVFVTYILTFIGSHKMKVILSGQALGLIISYICLFGNEMLLTSFFASCLITVYIIVLLEPVIECLNVRFLIWAVQGLLLAVGTVGMKIFSAKILNVADDAHIGDILRSKFTDFKNFHTMLYTCAAEFDFMEKETPWRVLKTLLGPCAMVVIWAVIIIITMNEYVRWRERVEQKLTNGDTGDHRDPEQSQAQIQYHRKHRSREHAEVVYHVFQLLAFTLMALIIMRLKLFWTPHLCLISSLIASPKFFGWIGPRYRQYAVVAIVMAGATVQGWANLSHQWNIMGEFSNVPQEELVEWINTKTNPNAVFAGPMPTMATVKLCTSRPIVNHPHYEDASLRERTKKVYTIYSRKSEEEVWRNLVSLQVNYTILEESWCLRRSRKGCGMAEVWDLEDVENREKIPVCARLHKKAEPYFKTVFRNKIYDVLEVLYDPFKGNGKR